MPKLKPTGYIPAAQHAIGFAKRMKERMNEAKRKREENEAEAKLKVKPLIKVKP